MSRQYANTVRITLRKKIEALQSGDIETYLNTFVGGGRLQIGDDRFTGRESIRNYLERSERITAFAIISVHANKNSGTLRAVYELQTGPAQEVIFLIENTKAQGWMIVQEERRYMGTPR